MSFIINKLCLISRGGRQWALVLLHAVWWSSLGALPLVLAAPAVEEFDSSTPSMLILHTGRTVTGKITRQAEAYVVRRDNGEMFVPAEAVRMQCRDLKDAYRRLRAGLPRENEDEGHVELARWCLTFQLLAEARIELQDALNLDPARDDARELLRRVDATLAPAASETPAADRAETSQQKRSSPFTAEEVESLAGLSRESAQKYMRRIQPILMNNCTLSGCHGPDKKQDFNLLKVSVGNDASRYTAERNLSAVMRQIDFKAPKNSKLLTVLDQNHGRRGRPVFSTLRGREQSAELRAWVLAVASERVKRGVVTATGKGRTTKSATGGELLVADDQLPLAQPPTVAAPRQAPADERPQPATAGPTGVSKPKPDPSVPPPPAISDPFDPATFNRGRPSS